MSQITSDAVENKAPSGTSSLSSGDALDAAPDINLLDLLIALGQEKVTLIGVTLLACVIGVVVSLMTPAKYVARTTIMPSQQSGGGATSLGGLGALGGLAGLAGLSSIAGSIKSSDEMYIALMRSYSVQTSLIEQLQLKQRYGAKTTEDARQALTNNVSIASDKKSGFLLIDGHDGDPEFAAQLANAQVRELNLILSRLAITEAQQRRVYYEQQILKIQAKIPELELEFRASQKSSGIEVASLLSEAGSLPSQIAAKELQLQVLSRFATQQNPEIKKLVAEVAALRSQLARYELSKPDANTSEQGKGDKTQVNSRSHFVQKATQAYSTLKIQEALLEGFVKQLEVAKLDEAKEGPILQVVDLARAPEIRAKPERRKIVRAYAVTGFLIAFVLAALKALMRHINSTDHGQARWRQLKNAWGFK